MCIHIYYWYSNWYLNWYSNWYFEQRFMQRHYHLSLGWVKPIETSLDGW